jgi:hypothetical protein
MTVFPLETIALPETVPPLFGETLRQTVLAVCCTSDIDSLIHVPSADAPVVVLLPFIEVVVIDDMVLPDTAFNEDVLIDVDPLETAPPAEVPSLEMTALV